MTVFVTDAGNREVLEYDGASGAIQRWYAYGLGSNDVLNQSNVAAGTRAALIPDIQGSVIASLDSATATLTKIGYLPYGKSASATAPFGYTGQRIDAETNGLYYYRSRHYSPAWGRFVQPDPIGYGGGRHLYAYVGNDPLNLTDPLGLAADGSQRSSSSFGSPSSALLPTVVAANVDDLRAAVAIPVPQSEDGLVQLAQAFPPTIFARPPLLVPRELTPLEELPGGSSGGPGAGQAFPRSFNNQQPDSVPCAYCGDPTTRTPGPDQLNGDHVIPRSQGGNNSPENYVPSCRSCNLEKGPQTPEEWYNWIARGGT
jgi:RHS repeat-associated protein